MPKASEVDDEWEDKKTVFAAPRQAAMYQMCWVSSPSPSALHKCLRCPEHRSKLGLGTEEAPMLLMFRRRISPVIRFESRHLRLSCLVLEKG